LRASHWCANKVRTGQHENEEDKSRVERPCEELLGAPGGLWISRFVLRYPTVSDFHVDSSVTKPNRVSLDRHAGPVYGLNPEPEKLKKEMSPTTGIRCNGGATIRSCTAGRSQADRVPAPTMPRFIKA
jgi:hypothetical protein